MEKKILLGVVLGLLLMAITAEEWDLRAQFIPGSPEQCLGGQLDAPIRIDVFSDFQCPACGVLYLETMRQVLRDYSTSNKVCVVYHEFPLPVHAHAREAARWSIAAQKLGRKQWVAVVDALYSHQGGWAASGKVEPVVANALSAEDYTEAKRILLRPEVDQILERDLALGRERKVESTPTMFITAVAREQKVVGGLPYAVLKNFFDRIVK